ncbi:MAG: oligoendopeptidase F [Haloarculaceae archaeon]
MSSVPERSEVDTEYIWDLESLYADDEDWEAAYETAQAMLDDLRAFEDHPTPDAETLLALLETHEEVSRQVSEVHTYARLRRDEDTRDSEAQAMSTRAESLAAEASEAGSFIEPAIQDLSREEVEAYMDEVAALEEYDHFLDDILRMKPHTRSPEVESLLADLSDVTDASQEVYTMLSNADMTFPTVEDPQGEAREITLSNFTTLQKHTDREFRRSVYEAFYDQWETVRNAVAASFRKNVTADRKLAKARNYDSAREAALDGPNVPVEVYDTLVDAVRDNVETLHRHADLKRESLGTEDLQMWDLYVPMIQGESPEVSYEQACEWVEEAVAPLGEDYQDRLAEGLDSRWVDVYETVGKKSGAYSSGTYDSQPYILMNYQDDVESMFTLAHELGHSLHSELAREAQPYVYYQYEIFIAEIASTVNETLLTHHLLDVVEDERLRRHILNEYLERFRSTLFRQTMFAEFEHRTHTQAAEGKPLTADSLDQTYRDLKETYYENAVVDDRIAREWMRIPHFYYGYYVYQYSTGISAAVALVEKILEEGEDAAAPYRDLLRMGSREYPLDLLDEVGLDLTDSDPIESAIGVYDDYLEEFDALL